MPSKRTKPYFYASFFFFFATFIHHEGVHAYVHVLVVLVSRVCSVSLFRRVMSRVHMDGRELLLSYDNTWQENFPSVQRAKSTYYRYCASTLIVLLCIVLLLLLLLSLCCLAPLGSFLVFPCCASVVILFFAVTFFIPRFV